MTTDRPLRRLHVNLGGVLDPSEVIGRDDEAARALASLGSHGALLTGDRRMGKTSLTRLIEARAAEAGATVIRVSAEGVSLGDFLDRLVRALRSDGAIKRELRRWTPSVEYKAISATRDMSDPSYDELFARATAAAGSGGLVLVIDEIPILARALEGEAAGGGAALLHLLRRARQDNSALSMILSGSIGFHHVVNDHTVVNDVDKIHVGPIADDEATYLAACLLLGEQVPTDDASALAAGISEAAESIPYYVHHLVDDLRNVATRRDAPVEAGDVAPLVDAALVDPDDPWDLRHYRDRLPGYYGGDAPLAAAALDAFAATDDALTINELHRALGTVEDLTVPGRDGLVHLIERLESDHYLARDGDGDRFTSHLLRRAWLRFRR